MAEFFSAPQAFASTGGGAAIGNPTLGTQGDVVRRNQLASALRGIKKEYPVAGKILDRSAIGYGPTQSDDRQLEFYPPWERDNPNPGKPTIEIYNRDLKGQMLANALMGDSLHLAGAINPETDHPVDPSFYALKQKYAGSLTPQQQQIDRNAYQMEGDARPFHDWMNQSRLDAHIRGYLTPDARNEWAGHYTPEQIQILHQMQQYLQK